MAVLLGPQAAVVVAVQLPVEVVAAVAAQDGIPYGPPAQTGSLGMLMHCVSDGPVGLMESYELPRHSASSGVAAQEGSSGPVGCAFAGTVAPAMPMSAATTTVFVTQRVIRRWWHVSLSIWARNKF